MIALNCSPRLGWLDTEVDSIEAFDLDQWIS